MRFWFTIKKKIIIHIYIHIDIHRFVYVKWLVETHAHRNSMLFGMRSAFVIKINFCFQTRCSIFFTFFFGFVHLSVVYCVSPIIQIDRIGSHTSLTEIQTSFQISLANFMAIVTMTAADIVVCRQYLRLICLQNRNRKDMPRIFNFSVFYFL